MNALVGQTDVANSRNFCFGSSVATSPLNLTPFLCRVVLVGQAREKGKRGRGNKIPESGEFHSARISEARLILDYSSPDEIEAVKLGTTKLNTAYERSVQTVVPSWHQ